MGDTCISWGSLLVLLIMILLIYNYTIGAEHFGPGRPPMLAMSGSGEKVPQYNGIGRPPGAGGGPIQVIQTQSGDITGVGIITTLDLDGTWTRSAARGDMDSGKIDPILAKKVISNAEGVRPSRGQGGCASCFKYSITLIYPSTQRIRKGVDNSVFPAGLF